MTDLLKHLNEDDDASIPLLYNEINSEEAGGLFTEDEIKASQKRKSIKLALKVCIPLILLIVLFVGIFKSYQNISYHLKNQQLEYKLHSITVKEGPKSSFLVSLNATIDTSIPWSVDISGVTIDLMNNEKSSKLASIKLNRKFNIASGKSIPLLLLDQLIEIKDIKALAELISKSANDKYIKTNVNIEAERIHPLWSPFTLKGMKVNKEINIDLKSGGLGDGNVSKYVKLIDLKMEESAGDELTVSAKLEVKNPLPISVDRIPPIAFKVYSEKKVFIGRLKTIGNTRLNRSGLSLIQLQGILGASEKGNDNSKTSDAIGELITNHLIGKSSRIYLQGDDGAKKFNWLQALLVQVTVPIDIPGRKGKKMFEDSIKRIDIKKILFALDPAKPNQIFLDSDAEIQIHIPRFASMMMRPSIESLALEGKVHDQRGNFIAPLSIADQKLTNQMHKSNGENIINTSMQMDIRVDSFNVDNVESLMAEMLYSQDFTSVSVSGSSSVKTKMLLGKITLPGIPFETEIKLPGLGRILASPHQTRISEFTILDVEKNEITASALISIINPTEITSIMGPMHLKCVSEASREEIGQVYLTDASIKPGNNDLKAKLQFKNNSAFQEVLSRFFSGASQKIILQGINGSQSVHPLIKNVIGAFVMNLTIDPKSNESAIFGKFVSAVTLKRAKFNLIPEAFMTVSNPFDFPIKVLSMQNLKVFAYKANTEEEVLITEMAEVPLEKEIVIPAKVDEWLDEKNPLPLQMNGNILRSLKALEMLFSRQNPKDSYGRQYLPIRIEGLIETEMAQMRLKFTFIKDKLPLYLEL